MDLFVMVHLCHIGLAMDQPVTTPAPSRAVRRITSSAIRELLALVDRPGVISLAGGLPSARHFPVEETLVAVDELLRGGRGALQYSSTEGIPALREWIAARHGVRPERVIVTHGSQQALDIVARAVLDHDDPVALADPGYVGAIQAMRLGGGSLVALPADEDGLAVEALAERLGAGWRPRLVYVVPNFHNPTGATLSAARARRLAHLADLYGFLVVEDDPYAEIRFSGHAPPPLATLTDRVVSIGTISKVLFPGLRVGWMVAPDSLAPSLALVKQAVDLHTSTLAQGIALHLLTRPGFLTDHVTVLRAHYHHQARVLCGALTTEFGADLEVTPPDGGLFLWARLRRPGIDTEALLPRAIDSGVAYVPGSAFSVSAPHRASLRLSYATVSPEDLAEGARRLASVVLGRHERPTAGTAPGGTDRYH
ncbi:MAG TPA: PLP-dependent aminotransferase family protein [Acidimicrobiales bacterium]|nr:PLP-dependent aminotransferase family protein [Acidimicrobiales bacterium]